MPEDGVRFAPQLFQVQDDNRRSLGIHHHGEVGCFMSPRTPSGWQESERGFLCFDAFGCFLWVVTVVFTWNNGRLTV